MSSRLATIASSLVAASLVATVFAPLGRADVSYVPPAVDRVTPVSTQHFAKPPPATRRAPQPASDMPPEPAMDLAHLKIALRIKREQNLAAFRAYAAAGVYPSNTYDNGELNVWRDRDGHLCAAATIISKSGATELVGRVAEQNNFIKLADVKQGPLEDWILTSGFTQDEIVLIQRPFRPVTVEPSPTVVPDKKAVETARLGKLYQQIDAQLVRDADKSLETAAERLLKHPTLAWQALGYGA